MLLKLLNDVEVQMEKQNKSSKLLTVDNSKKKRGD